MSICQTMGQMILLLLMTLQKKQERPVMKTLSSLFLSDVLREKNTSWALQSQQMLT